jgi:hypothetical protein
MSRTLATIAVVLLVVLAGCSGGAGPGTDGSVDDSDGGSATTGDSASTASVDFYLSDQRNDIGDFDHLNVTVSVVAFERANGEEGDEGSGDVEGEAEDDDVDESDNETDAEAADESTETVTTAVSAEDQEGNGNGNGGDGERGPQPRDRPGWVTREVDNVTVDLTRLEGANATLIDSISVPNGSYRKVAIWVDDINGTLTSGEQANVRLPSGRLQVQTPFTVGNNESVDFVFDISVVRAGNSGFYNIRPVVSESGPNREIREVGNGRDRGQGNDRGNGQGNGDRGGDDADDDNRGNGRGNGQGNSLEPALGRR